MTIGSLFSGIGGLELGLERAGLGPVRWQCEIDPFCRRVLAKHWPNAHRYTDVRCVGASAPRVDLICGGFPCQDLSTANVSDRKRLEGARSGLWREFSRVVGALRPRCVVVENVGNTWKDWVPVVRADLGGHGYASVPLALSAAEVGAPHWRPRCFVVAYADEDGKSALSLNEKASILLEVARPDRYWGGPPEAGTMGLAHGFPGDVVRRLNAYGNAVVPQVAEVIGRAIVATLSPAALSA